MTGVLFLCTANVCRSVMAEALLAARLAGLGVSLPVGSAGTAPAIDQPPPPGAVAALAARGHDISGHRGRPIRAGDLAGADLILGLAREHVRHAVVLAPGTWPRAFTLRELVRRARPIGPRPPGEPLSGWLARAGQGRDYRDLLGGSADDDVADPYGGSGQQYEFTADLLDQLAWELADLGWGFAAAR